MSKFVSIIILGFLFILSVFGCEETVSIGDGGMGDGGGDGGMDGGTDGGWSIFVNHHDGLLYLAAGSSVITPNAQNHPCPQYLAGTGQNRLPTGVHDELSARGVVFSQDGEYFVLVVLDLVGLGQPDVEKISKALIKYGISRDRVMVSGTHTHAGPDSMGIWGPDYATTGRCPEYIQFLTDTVAGMVLDLSNKMTPASMRIGETTLNYPGSDHPALIQDFRYPDVVHNRVGVATFKDGSNKTVATLLNWHAHPETMINSDKYSADFPQWARKKVEQTVGGTCIYLSGTVGGLQVPLDLKVPQRTADGEPVLDGGVQTYVGDNNEVKAWSLGYVLGEETVGVLEKATQVEPHLSVDTTTVDLPLTNMLFVLMNDTGLIAKLSLNMKRPDFCGEHGCVTQMVQLVHLGSLKLLGLPGEFFPESSTGREKFVKDWGGKWGEFIYPEMTGYRSALPAGAQLIEIGLANNEIGYVVPRSDFQPGDHPNYYCEQDTLSEISETILREAIVKMLGRTK